MAYFLFKCWHEKLFKVNKGNFVFHSNDELEFVPITEENAFLVKTLRGEIYCQQFLHQLSMGDFGYYAYLNGNPAGYGWAKHPGSDDYFYKIGENCVYLCRFFVHENSRGKGIYPCIISALVKREKNTDTFYIGVERGNVSSEKGLLKTGFEFIKEYGFIRGFKHTFNKKTLK